MSIFMAENTMGVKAVVGHVINDSYPASYKLAESMKKYPIPKNRLIETPFAMAYETGEPLFDYMEKHPYRINRCHEALRGINSSGPYSGETLAQGYGWSAFKSGTLVDVSHQNSFSPQASDQFLGRRLKWPHSPKHCRCFLLFQHYPSRYICRGNAKRSERSKQKFVGRVRFMEHDFSKSQPVKDADAYIYLPGDHSFLGLMGQEST